MAVSLYTLARRMYGEPTVISVATLEEVNSYRLQLLREYQEGNGNAGMVLLKAQYKITEPSRTLYDLMGFAAKAIEATMRAHKYFANRTADEDELQAVILRILQAFKTIKIDSINNTEALGNYLTATIRYSIQNMLRNTIRQENRGLVKSEWAVIDYIDDTFIETEIIDELSPNGPDEIYWLEKIETIYETEIDKVATKRQKETLDLFQQGKSYKEIALALGIAEGTAKGNIAALKANLAASRANKTEGNT